MFQFGSGTLWGYPVGGNLAARSVIIEPSASSTPLGGSIDPFVEPFADPPKPACSRVAHAHACSTIPPGDAIMAGTRNGAGVNRRTLLISGGSAAGLGALALTTSRSSAVQGTSSPDFGSQIPVAFLLDNGAVMIDFAGPWEVFQDSGNFHLFTVARPRTNWRRAATMPTAAGPAFAFGPITRSPPRRSRRSS